MTVPQQLYTQVTNLKGVAIPQAPVPWKPSSWSARFSSGPGSRLSPSYGALIKELDQGERQGAEASRPSIGRADVERLASDLYSSAINGTLNPNRVAMVFIASMVWGYGMVGYGPYRTERVLTHVGKVRESTPIEQLVDVAHSAQESGGIAAFELIARRRRASRSYLKYLGPAFGTKFIYFLTKAAREDATPVMDSVVIGWIQRNAPEAGTFNLSWWDSGSYARYVALLQEWALELSTVSGKRWGADDVELMIFQVARGGFPSALESEDVSPESMLDDLGTEADARGGETDKVGAMLVDALREWFALNPASEN